MLLKWNIILLLFAIVFIDVSGAFIGVNVGTEMSNMPSESEIVSILHARNIHHVRLYDADHKMLNALANTGIEVTVGVPNDQILRIGESHAEAANWVKQNIVTFVPDTNITYIAVGSEVLTTIPNAALVLAPAMQFLQSAIVAADLNFQVKVSTPHSMDLIPKFFPPSTATFNSTWNSEMYQLLQFLKNTGSSFMLNAQPYNGYTQGNGIFPLDFALFRALAPNKQIVDPNTNSHYNNMFDAMVDAAYYSMQAFNFSDIPILVTETGWPWLGGADEPAATLDNALAYNSNFVKHVLNDTGTSNQSRAGVNAFIYELFNEDLRAGPISAKNRGLFFPNGTSVYPVSFVSVAGLQSNSSELVGVFCVANASAATKALTNGLNWACGPEGSANCTAIQPGQPCYDTNITALASYAYNDYYHRTQSSGGNCNFGNTAYITTTDPSYGLCMFAGSSGTNSSSTALPPAVVGPTSPTGGVSKQDILWIFCLPLLMILIVM